MTLFAMRHAPFLYLSPACVCMVVFSSAPALMVVSMQEQRTKGQKMEWLPHHSHHEILFRVRLPQESEYKTIINDGLACFRY